MDILMMMILLIHEQNFSLCRSLVLRWVCCRQHMCGSCFLIHLATLCLLIGAFNPFTFKVIIDRYLHTAILLALYLCSFVSHCFSSCSQCKPFSISCRAGLEEVYSLRLLLSGKLFICLPFLLRALLDRVALVAGLCFLLLGIFLTNPLWGPR